MPNPEDYHREPSVEPRRGQRPTGDPDNYVLKIFYFNPHDDATMVPMRYGSGRDFNYARWPGKLALAVFALGVLATIATLFG